MTNTTKTPPLVGADSPGETMRDGRALPGLLLVTVGVMALAASLYLFGIGRMADGRLSAASAALIGAAGVIWLLVEHRRVAHLSENRRMAGPPERLGHQ